MKAIDKIITNMRHTAPSITGRVCAGLLFASLALSSCSDYFDPSPKGIMDADDSYSAEAESQVFKGMIGIMSAMQDAGDQAIFLTDTRMNVLETTSNAPDALQKIYNYDETDQNEYADPTCYYKIIIAVNDYIAKMSAYLSEIGGASPSAITDAAELEAYKARLSVSEQTAAQIPALLSSALRIKVWAYLQLGRNYGEAYWFDDPLNEQKALTDESVFTYCDMRQLTDKCLALLDNGIDVQGFHIASDLNAEWNIWFDQTSSEVATRQTYKRWAYLTPPYLLMRAELLSWKCNYLDEDAARSYWLEIRDGLLKYIYDIHTTQAGYRLAIPGFEDALDENNNYAYTKNDGGSDVYLGFIYQTNIPLQSDATSAYYNIFYTETTGSRYQVVSSIMYDYDNYRRNRLVQYFCPEWPGDGFYLRPSQYALKLKDEDPSALYKESDIRSITQKMVMNTLGGETCLSKYYYAYVASARTYKYLRDNIFEIQPSIVTFRGHDFHFLLAEAENHLGNFRQAQSLLNGGITNEFAERFSETTWPESDAVLKEGWSPYYGTWFGSAGGYGDAGIAGVANGTLYDKVKISTDADGVTTYTLNGTELSAEQVKEYIDWCLAEEASKEYVAEGRAYGYLCKMAERYSHAGRGTHITAADKMADIITPKYTAVKAAKVRSSLEAKYFINWNLKDLKR